MSHLETSNADSAQSKDVWNENLEFLRSSDDCLLSADCLETSNADSARSKDVWNENLEYLVSSAVCLFSADCLLGQKNISCGRSPREFPLLFERDYRH